MSPFDDSEEKEEKLKSRIEQFKSENEPSKEFSVWSGLTLFSSLGLAVAVSLLIGIGLGVYLDRHFHTEPWLTLLGLLLGLLAAFKSSYELVKGVLKEKK